MIGIGASVLGVLTTRFCLEVFDLPISTGGTVAVLIGILYVIGQMLKRSTQSVRI
jgi:hypothetical protein